MQICTANRCKHTNIPQPEEEFRGKDGSRTKRCRTCREKHNKYRIDKRKEKKSVPKEQTETMNERFGRMIIRRDDYNRKLKAENKPVFDILRFLANVVSGDARKRSHKKLGGRSST